MTSTTIPTKHPQSFVPAAGTRSERPCDVVLTDGSRVVVRVYESRDRDALVAALDALSAESRRTRFLSAATKLAPGLVRHLVDVDQDAHVVLIAEHAGRIVGDARYVRARSEPGAAEMAFFVADDFQRRGLGRAMVLTATALARVDGIETLTFTVAADNMASRALLAQLGVGFRWDDGVLAGRVTTAEVARPAGACPTALHAQLLAQRSDRRVAA